MQSIDHIPEELILHVFDHFNVEALSETKNRDEPVIGLTHSTRRDLKNISLVCKKWRRIVLPLLFRHSRLRLGGFHPRPQTCAQCSADVIQERVRSGRQVSGQREKRSQYHADMVDEAVDHLRRGMNEADHVPHILADDEVFTSITTWIPRFYHDLETFLDFVIKQDLTQKIESFALLTELMLQEKLSRFPHCAAGQRDWRYRAVAAFWPHLLQHLNPRRITILAPPIDLSCLTLSAMDTFGDWAFGDMDYHLLTLECDPSFQPELAGTVDYHALSYIPTTFPSVARSSILYLRPWTSIELNEGSFLRAYGTYEYFERGPPSVIHSISPVIWRTNSALQYKAPSTFDLMHLKKFVYTGIFPFAGHLDFNDLLMQLEVLDLQLAPSPMSNLLNDKERVGKAELMDCWSELVQTYQSIAGRLSTFFITAANTPFLQTMICRDHAINELREELDVVFTPLCLPVWAEYAPGVFKRIALEPSMRLG